MYNGERIKLEYYNKYTLRCHGCLSLDRRLYDLDEYIDIFRLICSNLNTEPQLSVYLCWECMATLKKVKLFREKVEKTQAILSYQYNCLDKEQCCMSNLTIANINPETTLFIKEGDVDNKPNIQDLYIPTKSLDINPEITLLIKEEDVKNKPNIQEPYVPTQSLKEPIKTIKEQTKLNYNSSDNENDLNEDNYHSQNEVKTELTVKVKEHSKPRNQKYRMIIDPSNEGELTTKVSVDVSELEHWIERERGSVLFKSLQYKCDKCMVVLKSLKGVESHGKRFHDMSNGSYSCAVCHSYFATKASLSVHVGSHSHIWRCNMCGYQSVTSSLMKCHLEVHQKTVQCMECCACYKNVRQFFAHYRAMHRVCVCDYCNKQCATKAVLEKHINRWHQTHRCNICDITFKSHSTLRGHNLLKHVTACTEAAFCVKCDLQFNNERTFRRHVLTSAAHAAERDDRVQKKVRCPECDKVYSRRCYMMNHLRHVHRKQSRFLCTLCDKAFLNRTRWRDHMRYNHEGCVKAKDKLCNICGRSFAANRTLENHMRTHSGERPFACTHCDAKFTQKQAMLFHVRFIHLKDRRRPT